MSGHSPSRLHRQNRTQNPSWQTFLVVSIALFVLFLWLHFIIAQQIESLGREIQIQEEELGQIQRWNNELRIRIANAKSQENMVRRAMEMGYELQTPVYLLFNQPLIPGEGQSGSHHIRPSTTVNAGQVQALQDRSLWDMVARQSSPMYETAP